MRRWAKAMAVVALASAAGADETVRSYVQPSLSLFGTSEHTRGPAYLPPNDGPGGDLAPSAAFGLDGAVRRPGRALQASAFAFAHDPLSDDGRSLYVAGRLRGHVALGSGWHFRLDDSARLQRRESGTLADFQRNDLVLGLERVLASGTAVGVRAGDRRRSVGGSPALGFDRQAVAGSVTWGEAGRSQWRLEIGPQHYSAATTRGWRIAGTAEWAGRAAGWSTAVRATWLEPSEGIGSQASSALDAFPAAAPAPTTPPPQATPAPPVIRVDEAPRETQMVVVRHEPLLGPSLIVDPLEDDENDWDFGRRKQEVVAVAARAFGRLVVTAEMRADVERGPDLLGPFEEDVRRERLAARLHLRHEIGAHWSLLAQAGWQHVTDNRPRLGYSRGLFSIGLELRP